MNTEHACHCHRRQAGLESDFGPQGGHDSPDFAGVLLRLLLLHPASLIPGGA
jgi:hypothetical protein